MSNLGASFKKARETAGIPLAEIAAETRISTRFLVAIENETFQLLPGGIFNRGFIRAYAEYLGINAEQALADYDRISAATQQPTDVLREVEQNSTRTSDRNLYPIAAAILVVLVVAYYLVTHRAATPPHDQAPQTAAQPAPETTPEANITTATPTPEAQKSENDVAHAAPTTAVTPTPAPASVSAPVSVPVQAPVKTVNPSPVASVLALDVEAKEETWIQVATDGTPVFSDVLQSGATRHFSGDRLIDITIGNAAGASLKINGRDPGQLGTSGQVRQLKITPENAAQIR